MHWQIKSSSVFILHNNISFTRNLYNFFMLFLKPYKDISCIYLLLKGQNIYRCFDLRKSVNNLNLLYWRHCKACLTIIRVNFFFIIIPPILFIAVLPSLLSIGECVKHGGLIDHYERRLLLTGLVAGHGDFAPQKQYMHTCD